MSKFSKGQWHVESEAQLICNEDNVIAEVFYPRREREQTPEGKAEQAANCRLISAAPEMYKLLREELVPTSDYGGILSFARSEKIRKLLVFIDGTEVEQ